MHAHQALFNDTVVKIPVVGPVSVQKQIPQENKESTPAGSAQLQVGPIERLSRELWILASTHHRSTCWV